MSNRNGRARLALQALPGARPELGPRRFPPEVEAEIRRLDRVIVEAQGQRAGLVDGWLRGQGIRASVDLDQITYTPVVVEDAPVAPAPADE